MFYFFSCPVSDQQPKNVLSVSVLFIGNDIIQLLRGKNGKFYLLSGVMSQPTQELIKRGKINIGWTGAEYTIMFELLDASSSVQVSTIPRL
jgi:hypothetical protein